MKSKLFTAMLLATVGVSNTALAAEVSPFSANVTLASDYLYRGISQTNGKPAIQGGFDYKHSSGFYAGIWGSNISWLSDAAVANGASIELDTYFGFAKTLDNGIGYDVGYLRYNYPGNYAAGAVKADTDEIYGALSYKWFTAKYSYSIDDTFGVANSDGTDYLDLSASYTFDGTGITIGAHYGRQDFDGTGNDVADYEDYNISIAKEVNGYKFKLLLNDTDSGTFYTNPQGNDLGEGTAVLSVSRSL